MKLLTTIMKPQASAQLLADGLRDYPYEFALAIVDGDMHAACIFSRRMSSACRNVRIPAVAHRWGDI